MKWCAVKTPLLIAGPQCKFMKLILVQAFCLLLKFLQVTLASVRSKQYEMLASCSAKEFNLHKILVLYVLSKLYGPSVCNCK